MPYPTAETRVDALLVLGRGIDEQGVLSETSRLRAEMAIDIARIVLPKRVVFSGGHSWVQERRGEDIPSEGGAMLKVARTRADEAGLASDVELLAENTSTSTVENMVNSKPCLMVSSGDTLGILTDHEHDEFGRVTYLGKLVFPDQQLHVFDIVPNAAPPGVKTEERLAAMMTRTFMWGVQSGNDMAIMRRQHLLEGANRAYRAVTAR